MHKNAFLCSIALISAAAAASAAPETVVVTATRTAQPLELTGTSMSVITAQDLRTQQIDAVSDALAETPGVTIVRNGGVGQSTDVLMRGAEAGQTLVLIDGVRINDPSSTTGFALLGDVLVNGIDRIEVLRGPQSTLYGSDAIGGVINILTKRGGGAPLTLQAQAEGGSFDTYKFILTGNGTVGPVEYGGAANYYGSNSVSAADARNGNTEPDGYHNLGLTGNARWHLTDWLSLDARAYYTHARDSFDGFPPPNFTFQDTHEFGRNSLVAIYGGANLSLLNGRFANRFAVTRSDGDRRTYDPTMAPEENFFGRGGVTRFEYQGVFDLDDANQITFGAENENTTLVTHSAFDPTPAATRGSDRINGYYGQWQTTLLDVLTLTGGIRYDADREFGGHTSLKLAAAWQVIDGTTLRANYGDGFKAPTLYELFSQYSNPLEALRPEAAKGWEAGIDQKFLGNRIAASLTYFERRTKNQIDFFSCFNVTSTACSLRAAQGGYYFNVDRSRATGFEADITGNLTETLSVAVNYTNLTDTDLASGLQLARRPHSTVNGTATWRPLPDISMGVTISYVGSRFDDAGHFTPLPDMTHVSLYGAYKITDALEVFGRVENLTDNLAEPVAGYGTPGRAFYAGVRTNL